MSLLRACDWCDNTRDADSQRHISLIREHIIIHVILLVVHHSNEPTPQASSQECVQAPSTDDATLSAPTVDYEYQPHVQQIE